MILFLDTEFADSDGDELVSLAPVSQDARHVFYAERNPLPVDATPFVQQHVDPLLSGGNNAMDDQTLMR
ncbi:hypothetical protein GCM10010981_32320 [Dyella nitratireducens]|uniref:Uncharacterized protein n=1 Tax=Dyella nitratireducens TaxID=1849580 RepID=A0ABQ1GBT5_9GAMM|nr:hypothetical protein GCM10010981_32320 [Dyella nitratireducens]GLQ40590.1 hypothetical protein GCM10007902_04390 [Dyella nitratireducens]